MHSHPQRGRLSRGIHTTAVHAARATRPDPYGAHVVPIYQTSTFVLESAEAGRRGFAGEDASYLYSRISNPTVEALESALAELEGGAHGMVFGSGMAAISTFLLAHGRRGTVIAQEALYGCTSELLARQAGEMGLRVAFVDPADLDGLAARLAAEDAVSLVYLETPANPTMSLCDLGEISRMAHARGALVVVDNTFATPYHQQPLALGADAVVHSTTKYLGGHGTVIGGALVVRDEGLLHEVAVLRKNLGGIAGPFDAWLVLNGLKTFALRMERHAANALRVARWLESHPAVDVVHYPGLPSHPHHALARRQMERGFSGVLSFELAGGYDAGVAFLDAVRLCTLAVSLGTPDTLVQHPASMTHSVMPPELRRRAGIRDGLVRLSVGLEDVEDIIADLEQALAHCETPKAAVA